MAASDLTSTAFLFKKLYSTGTGDVAARTHPRLTRTPRKTGFGGLNFNYAIRYGNPQGVSGSFANAQTNAASSKGVQMLAIRKIKYGVITLDGEAMAACENDGAFLDLLTMETNGVLAEMGDSYAYDLYRDGSGNRGKRASASTNVITLATPDDARNFKVGMTVIASSNADGSSPRTGSTTVAAIDEDGGTVTLTSAAGITSFADNDFLFRQGDPGTCFEGLAKTTPLAVPTTGDSFRGVDRSVDPRRLAGARLNDTSSTIEENAGRVAIRVAQSGGKCEYLDLNPANFYTVARRLNAKVEYDGAGGDAMFGFERISIATPAGVLKVYSDPDAPTTLGYVGRTASEYIKTQYELPHIIMDDGNRSLRSVSADSIEARARGFGNYIQPEPRDFGVFAI